MNDNNKKDKTVAGILALFFGSFGVHHFYLGNGGTGLLYLLFFWFPLTWIVSFVDAIQLFTRSEAAFDRRYNPHLYVRQYEQPKKIANDLGVADELYKLNLLFKNGVITFEEFERRKARLLD